MKKNILLTTTAMLLSAIAMNTNAASNSAELEIHAMFLKPMELISEQYLGFGIILADEGGKKVVVKPDGSLGEDTDATMIAKATFDNNVTGDGSVNVGALNEGLIRAKGILNDIVGEVNEGNATFGDVINAGLQPFSIDLSSDSVKLISISGIECGTVKDFKTNITTEGNDMLIHVGGTLYTENLNNINNSPVCSGSTTVTVIMNVNEL